MGGVNRRTKRAAQTRGAFVTTVLLTFSPGTAPVPSSQRGNTKGNAK